jgi:hypothetical protein
MYKYLENTNIACDKMTTSAVRVNDNPQTSMPRVRHALSVATIQKATGQGLANLMAVKRIANNVDVDPVYMSGDAKKVAFTGFLAYAAPGKEFGETIHFGNAVLHVPKKFQGMKDTALYLGSRSVEVSSNGKLSMSITDEKKVKVIEGFPATDGYYITEPTSGIPQGTEVSKTNPNARYLWRVEKGQYIGPTIRDPASITGNRGIVAEGGLNLEYNVVLLGSESRVSSTQVTDAIRELLRIPDAENIAPRAAPALKNSGN